MTTITRPSALDAPARRVLLVAVLAALPAGAVSAAVSVAAGALGAPAIPQLTPVAVALFAAVGAAVAVLGWQVVRRRSARPRRMLARLIPVLLAASFVPDVVLGSALASTVGVAPALVLAAMHVTTAAIVVLVCSRLLPLPDDRVLPSGGKR